MDVTIVDVCCPLRAILRLPDYKPRLLFFVVIRKATRGEQSCSDTLT